MPDPVSHGATFEEIDIDRLRSVPSCDSMHHRLLNEIEVDRALIEQIRRQPGPDIRDYVKERDERIERLREALERIAAREPHKYLACRIENGGCRSCIARDALAADK